MFLRQICKANSKSRAMELYMSKSGKTAKITAYEIGKYSIIVEFDHKTRCIYTHNSTGVSTVEEMKLRASSYENLSNYINENKPSYEIKYGPLYNTFKFIYENLFEENRFQNDLKNKIA